jgi:tetratricopeptide (TPR) repeat protein
VSASGVASGRAAPEARKLARPLRRLALFLLFVSSILVSHSASAYSDSQEASLKAAQGRAALLRAQFLEAEQWLTGALDSAALPPEFRSPTLNDRGVSRWRLNRLHEAMGDFNAALRLTPEDATLYNNRGNVLAQLGLLAEAATDFGQAIALAPTYGAAYHNRANAWVSVGDYEAAVADFKQGDRLDAQQCRAVQWSRQGPARP